LLKDFFVKDMGGYAVINDRKINPADREVRVAKLTVLMP
jgi:hypothetical protein